MRYGMIWLNLEIFSGRTFGFDEKCSSTLIINLLEAGVLSEAKAPGRIYKNQYVLPVQDENNYAFAEIELRLKGESTPVVGGFFSRAILELENLAPPVPRKEKVPARVPKKYRENLQVVELIENMEGVFTIIRHIQDVLEYSSAPRTFTFMVPFTLAMLNPQLFLTFYAPSILVVLSVYTKYRPYKLNTDLQHEHDTENIAMVIKFTRYVKMVPELINENIFWQNEHCTTGFLTWCTKYAVVATLVLALIDLKYIILVAAWREVVIRSPFAMLLINYVFVEQLPKVAGWAYLAFLYILDLVLPRIIG
jgi:hypothetical protein